MDTKKTMRAIAFGAGLVGYAAVACVYVYDMPQWSAALLALGAHWLGFVDGVFRTGARR